MLIDRMRCDSVRDEHRLYIHWIEGWMKEHGFEVTAARQFSTKYSHPCGKVDVYHAGSPAQVARNVAEVLGRSAVGLVIDVQTWHHRRLAS